MRVLPHLQDTGGFFIAVFEKLATLNFPVEKKEEEAEVKKEGEKETEIKKEETEEKNEGKEEIPVIPEDKVKNTIILEISLKILFRKKK